MCKVSMIGNQTMYPAISVIVAVYKAEDYLRRCVDSLLCQTFPNFEVLLIDDGSPDRSGEICDEYAAKDSRVRVFHKENEGVSATRQFGIDHALGEYTIHADPDDWVESTMLERLYQMALKSNADLVMCDYFEVSGTKVKYIQQKPASLFHDDVLRDLFRTLHGSCGNKLVRLSCYAEYGVRFPENINYCEDLYTWLVLLQNPIKIVYLNSAFYYYDRSMNVNSITAQYRKTAYKREKSFFDKLVLLLDKELYSRELIVMKSRLAFAAIVCKDLSQQEYIKQFYDLRKGYIVGTLWNRLCVRFALSGFLSVAEFMVSLRHSLRKIKDIVWRL